jgi:Fic family protein
MQTSATCPDFAIDAVEQAKLTGLHADIAKMRAEGVLSPSALKRISRYFRIETIYHSNAIEGNSLTLGETRLVVEEGLTITGKPLKDTLEAKNLAHALDLFEGLADRSSEPITSADLRSLHAAVLKGINDREAGKYRDVRVAISGSPHLPPGPESVPAAMIEFGDWLKSVSKETIEDPVVLACAAHACLAYIHPFIDGNGRVCRLLMNLILMRFGYPIAVIANEERFQYYNALRAADGGNLTELCALVEECVRRTLREYRAAVEKEHES